MLGIALMPELLFFNIKGEIKSGFWQTYDVSSSFHTRAFLVLFAHCAYERHVVLEIIVLFIVRKGISIKNK